MQTSDRGPRGPNPGSSGPRIPVHRDYPPVVFLATIMALACTDAPTAPEVVRRGDPIRLNEQAALAVETVLADVHYRVADAIEDSLTRTAFTHRLSKLTASINAGALDTAETEAFAARLALALAATLDSDGTGDADRAAITLALDVANDEITKARRLAAGE